MPHHNVLIPVAYFGDKNSLIAKRLAIIAFIAGLIRHRRDLLWRLAGSLRGFE